MDLNEITRKELEKVRVRDWREDIGEFDSFVVLPAKIRYWSIVKYNARKTIAKLFKLEEPPIYEVDGLHDSGYRAMDFVACVGDKPICRLSGCSDVINLEGIGGYGYEWFEKYGKVPRLIPPPEWSIDCLAKSGLLRFFQNTHKIIAGNALSSFEVYSVRKEMK